GAYLVGCDGAHSVVRHQAGMTFQGDTIPKMFYIADVTLNSAVISEDQLFMFLIKKGFILFFPMEGAGHYRIIGILPGHIGDIEFTFNDIEDSIKQQVAVPVTFEEVRWFSAYKVHSRMANSFMNGRCFIAGDAAHIHTPAGGQGMNTGIQDVYNLAWKLAFTINGAKTLVLESYNTERMENAEHLLRTTDRIFDIMTGSDKFLNFLRLRVFPIIAGFVTTMKAFNKRIFPLLSQTGIAYPNSSLTIKSRIGIVKAGDRMHYFPLPGGNIFDMLTEPVFKVLYFGKDSSNFEKLKGLKQVAIFSFKEIPKDLFGNASDFYILLRPDNHISYIGKETEACIKLLHKIGTTAL
ncbi:MAG TPA: FAD-dependent monooxygenase, partial [Ferruginibacter sp.]|nr:FAD-dependent monooxygenase [Ferruginibacter sp.]